MKNSLHDFIPTLDSSIPIYNGGPVEQDNLYFIHKIPELIHNSIEIANGIYWGGDFNEINKKENTFTSETQKYLYEPYTR